MRKTLAAFFIIFVCQSAVAAPNCQAIFGGEAPVFRSLAEKQAQVEEWLAPISASVVPQFSLLSLVSRFQERLLLLRMDSAQLGNPQFREWFVKSLVTIRMRAYSRPFAEFALSRDSAKQQAIERLVVQSLLENGLRNWPLGTTPKNFGGRVLKVARAIRFNPILRGLVELRIPSRTIVLNEAQIAKVIEFGSSAFRTDPVLADVLKSFKRTSALDKLNLFVRNLVYAGLISVSAYQYLNYETKIEAQATQQVQADAIATAEFTREVTTMTRTIDADQAMLGLAKQSIEIVVADYESKYGAVTPKDRRDIVEHVCKRQLGGAIGNGPACLAL
ncbi:MAG: hypothetical protein AAB250_17645 [Bdellovibrionota bacterium]